MGVQLALACDIILAAEHAKFIQLFVRRGIMPGGGSTYLLPRLVGPQKAKELLFFGDDLPGLRGLPNRFGQSGGAIGSVDRMRPARWPIAWPTCRR